MTSAPANVAIIPSDFSVRMPNDTSRGVNVATEIGVLWLFGAAYWGWVTITRVRLGTTHTMFEGRGPTFDNQWSHFLIGLGLTIGLLIIGLSCIA